MPELVKRVLAAKAVDVADFKEFPQACLDLVMEGDAGVVITDCTKQHRRLAVLMPIVAMNPGSYDVFGLEANRIEYQFGIIISAVLYDKLSNAYDIQGAYPNKCPQCGCELTEAVIETDNGEQYGKLGSPKVWKKWDDISEAIDDAR